MKHSKASVFGAGFRNVSCLKNGQRLAKGKGSALLFQSSETSPRKLHAFNLDLKLVYAERGGTWFSLLPYKLYDNTDIFSQPSDILGSVVYVQRSNDESV